MPLMEWFTTLVDKSLEGDFVANLCMAGMLSMLVMAGWVVYALFSGDDREDKVRGLYKCMASGFIFWWLHYICYFLFFAAVASFAYWLWKESRS